jgi:dTDP-4-amino-4,6-dideoxygalactose transaminase
MTSATLDRHHGHAYSYDVTDLGYNYRIDEIHAALARCQLKKLKKGNERRRLAAIRYKNALSKIDKITIPFADYSFSANYHIFPILLSKSIDRHSLMVFLRGKGIQTSIHYPPVHKFSYYKTVMGDQILRNTDSVSRHELTLPMYAGITGAQIDYVIDALINFIDRK